MAVHDAAGVVGVVEVDDVVADEVHRHLRLAQRLHEPGAQRDTSVLLAPDPHVGREQRHHHVHVAGVERERVAHRELTDLGERLEPVEPLVGSLRVPRVRGATWRRRYRQVRTSVGGRALGREDPDHRPRRTDRVPARASPRGATTRCGGSPASATRRAAAQVEALGVTTRVCDIASGDFTDVPDDFTYVVHLAAFQGAGPRLRPRHHASTPRAPACCSRTAARPRPRS